MAKLFAVIDATVREDLETLTLHRMPGALPFAGKFRLIDFTLSNMRNSHITNVAIFPYGNYRSLQDHIGSGKRWDLDRRKDGLFILPPKNRTLIPREMLTFQRMNEHIEYFLRGTQEYCVVTSANLLWNIDFNRVLDQHINSKANITEVIYRNIRLKTFVLSKKRLLEYIQSYESLEYETLLDVVEKSPNIHIHIYKHPTYTRTISDPFHYLKANLDMLRFEVGKQIFTEDRPILSKEKTAPPARYKDHAFVSNAMVSAGAFINGTVINSIVGRDVIIKQGAIVKNSFIMSNSVIEENAKVDFAILDKQTIIKEGTVVEGTLRAPFISQKEQVITNQKSYNILISASESYPYIKTGGLADVIGSLSRNLVRTGAKVTVVLPLYKKIRDTFDESLERGKAFTIIYNNMRYKIRLYHATYHKANYVFIENFDFFDTDKVYGYENDFDRFAFFSKAIVDIIDELGKFDLVHIHDWHTALIPILLDNSSHQGMKSLLTIHNIGYQGEAKVDIIKKLGIKNYVYNQDTLNFLETGILTATKLSTVSQTYKEELKYEYYGKNLTYSLMKRDRDFYGILNGISSVYNPQDDTLIHTNYDVNSLHLKVKNKTFLQKEMDLPVVDDAFIIGMVTRIVEHKGFELILQSFHQLLEDPNIYFVLLGTGDERIIDELIKIQNRFPNQVRLNLGYDATVPNYIYAGSDTFLMPSRFEPCGLGQMIAQRYGTLPIVRKTGGLSDTVEDFDPLTKKGNGFSFDNYSADEMLQKIIDAKNIFTYDKDSWRKLQNRTMKLDHSVLKQAQKYADLYKSIIEND